MNEKSLTAVGLTKSYQRRRVVSQVDLTASPGEIVGLLGPSGSGKSTIFEMLTGVTSADAGRVILGSKDVTYMNIEARAHFGLGYVSQVSNLFDALSTEQNLLIAFSGKVQEGARRDELMDIVLRIFGLTAFRQQVVGELSGGQRKMVELAFAICTKPTILLLDEPFAGLDPIKVDQISDYLRILARIGVGIILTDHKVHDALKVIHRVYVINEGQLIQSGSPHLIAQDPLVRRVFLGENFNL